MPGTYGVKNCGERPKLIQIATVAFKIIAIQNDSDISKFVLMARHGTCYGLAELGENDVPGAQAGAHR